MMGGLIEAAVGVGELVFASSHHPRLLDLPPDIDGRAHEGGGTYAHYPEGRRTAHACNMTS